MSMFRDIPVDVGVICEGSIDRPLRFLMGGPRKLIHFLGSGRWRILKKRLNEIGRN